MKLEPGEHLLSVSLSVFFPSLYRQLGSGKVGAG